MSDAGTTFSRASENERVCTAYRDAVRDAFLTAEAGPPYTAVAADQFEAAGAVLLRLSIGTGAAPDLTIAILQVGTNFIELAKEVRANGDDSIDYLREAHAIVLRHCSTP